MTSISTSSPKTFEEVEARLAERLPNYEPRSQQQRAARHIEECLRTNTHGFVQAGTGTGKSLAYLIPAILDGRRTLVAPSTKALQDQLALKDLPFLQEHIGVPFTWALLKGRSNYFCARRAREADSDEVPNLARFLEESERDGFVGERDSFSFEIDSREWFKVCSDSDECGEAGCAKDVRDGLRSDFAELARAAARKANIVIVNHSLFFTDLSLRGAYGISFLDEYGVVVLDEGHNVEDTCTSTLGEKFSEGSVRGLSTEIRNFVRRNPGDASAVNDALESLAAAQVYLWASLTPGRIRQSTILENEDQFISFSGSLQTLAQAFGQFSLEDVPSGQLDKAKNRKKSLQRRINNAVSRFNGIITDDWHESVRWVSEGESKRYGRQLAIETCPIDVSGYLRSWLFAPAHPLDADGNPKLGWQPPVVLLVSATLTVEDRFDYIAKRLGVDDHSSVDVGSPFDYPHQARLYVPSHLPEPSGNSRISWENLAQQETLELVRASRGRALLLFTSLKQMRNTYNAIKDQIPYPSYIQGSAPNVVLAERFKEETDSVLFAVKSFFEGVDVQGESLSLVVVDKTPFPVPTDPIFEARCEVIDARGGNAFRDLSVPSMILPLQQAFGRLIRHRSDTGVVAILDPRLNSKGWGKTVLRSLPPATRITKLDDVIDFFGEG